MRSLGRRRERRAGRRCTEGLSGRREHGAQGVPLVRGTLGGTLMAGIRAAQNDRADLEELESAPAEASGPSVLVNRGWTRPTATYSSDPATFLSDLNLDQAIGAIAAGRDRELAPLFAAALTDRQAIRYRHEVMRDLERTQIAACVDRFVSLMHTMRRHRTQIRKLYHQRQREVWLLQAVSAYCQAARVLADGLAQAKPRSPGLRAISAYLDRYVASEAFVELGRTTADLETRLHEITYELTIKGNRIKVARSDPEPDYTHEVEAVFDRFRQGAVKDYRVRFPTLLEMGHVNAAILEYVARLNQDVFDDLARCWEQRRSFADATIATFEREVQFYLAYQAYIEPLKRSGLPFCYPTLTTDKDVDAHDTFDLPLAHKLITQGDSVVLNDWHLSGGERIFVVSGPNQGGKTTFARTFGQLHHLARLGLPVPGRQARLVLCDRIFTHFERREDHGNPHGKLQDDLVRVHDILSNATDRSVIVMNESFTSTSLADATFIGREVLRRMTDLDVLGVYVTFVDELASLDEAIVSATSTVDDRDPAVRTFKVERRPADGLAYAMAIAEKHRLTYDTLVERLTR